MPTSPTYVSILTPAGRGAVATVAVRGPQAAELVERRLVAAANQTPSLKNPGRIRLRSFRALSGNLEELIVVAIECEQIDIHCHGGLAAANAVADALVSEGAEKIGWQQWTALVEEDSMRAEARIALAQARTERSCAVLLDQYRGALSAALADINRLMAMDQPEPARQLVDRLLALAPCGLHLTRPWQVVLAGAPNVGKSSLINALVGYQRSIVFDQPGTTRDVLSAATAIDGWPVELFDTAGLRGPGDTLEAAGIEQARRHFDAADLVLRIEDATQPPGGIAAPQWPALRCFVLSVLNKCDLIDDQRRQELLAQNPSAVPVSAKTGAGLDTLCAVISRTLVPEIPQPGESVPFTQRQIELVESLAARLRGEPVVDRNC